MTAISYRPEIDGLRAFAVLPVILFHMDFNWIAGGYLGVDVFFVISGFLITSILKKEIDAGTFSFREFWARRIRRILPAMIVVTATILTLAHFFLFKPDHPAIGKGGISALLSVANLYFWRVTGDSGGYWGTLADESPFLHTWSLSLEEQFYLAFPVAIWLVLRFRPRWLQGLILFVIIASLSIFLYGALAHPAATFYLLPTRAWELATGCYLALVLPANRVRDPKVEHFESLALLGLCMVIAACFFVPNLNGGLAIAVLGTALIIAFAQSGLCHTILAQRHIVHVGKMSYSLYLWHWPVLVIAGELGYTSYKWLLIVPIYLLSLISYYLVEKPTRRRSGMIPAIGVCYVLTLGFSALLASSSPFYDTSAFEQPTYIPHTCHPLQLGTWGTPRKFGTTQLLSDKVAPDAYLNGGVIIGKGAGDPKVVVLGDSHGCMWSDAIRTATERLGAKTSFYCVEGISPFVKLPLTYGADAWGFLSKEKYEYEVSRLHFISQWKPAIVIVCACWSRVSETEATDLLEFLEVNSSQILLVEQPPELGIGDRNALQFLCSQGVKPEIGRMQYLPFGNREQYERGRMLVRELASKFKNCDVVPVCDLYVANSQVMVLNGKNIVYLDDDHLVTFGASLAIDRFGQIIADNLSGYSQSTGQGRPVP